MAEPRSSRANNPIGAYAIVHGDEPLIFLAEDEGVLARVLAVQLVSTLSADEISSPAMLTQIRSALSDGDWTRALALWIAETSRPVDVYSESPHIWSADDQEVRTVGWVVNQSDLFAS